MTKVVKTTTRTEQKARQKLSLLRQMSLALCLVKNEVIEQQLDREWQQLWQRLGFSGSGFWGKASSSSWDVASEDIA